MALDIYDAAAVRALLDYPGCIAAVRAAMCALSADGRQMPLREILQLSPDHLFATMPGVLSAHGFGAKLVSVFPNRGLPGRSRHQGVVVLFDEQDGRPLAIADAEEVTAIRTGAASAVATDVLARPGARRLAILGNGLEAATHLRAIACVRPLEDVAVWGRSPGKVGAFVARMSAETGLPIRAVADAREAVAGADIVCTVTASPAPVLEGAWVKPGTHVNVVGSSYAGPMEVDHALVAASRFIADSVRSVKAAGAEYLSAREAGLIREDHLVGEIGDVLLGRLPGRRDECEITLYKSLGHIVQDLAAVRYIHERRHESCQRKLH